jgi:hypothetical protein
MRGETAAPSVTSMPATASAADLAQHLQDIGPRPHLTRSQVPIAAVDTSWFVRRPLHTAQSAELRRAEPPAVSLFEPVADVGAT